MRYSPNSNNVKSLMISILFTVVSVTFVLFASRLHQYKWLMQLIFICSATVAIQIFLKYVLTKMEYVCEDNNLLIYKSLGRKKVMIASIPLSYSQSLFLSIKDFEEARNEYDFSETYIYTRNLNPECVYCYVSNVTSKGELIKIECSEEFAEYVNSIITSEQKGNEYNEEV